MGGTQYHQQRFNAGTNKVGTVTTAVTNGAMTAVHGAMVPIRQSTTQLALGCSAPAAPTPAALLC